MGSEIITFLVGPTKQAFSVHKNLLIGTGNYFRDFLSTSHKDGQPILMSGENPSSFKLFIEYLYTKNIPGVLKNALKTQQAVRLRELCQLYTFSDRYQLKNHIRNKIMDSIQDGFRFMDKFPEAGLVTAIYANTSAGSKLRDMCIYGLIYSLRSAEYVDDGSLAKILADHDAIMADFLIAVRTLEVPDRDPRIRDCEGEPGCVECAGNVVELEHRSGIWPCSFHVHLIEETGVAVTNPEVVDNGCYLWS